MPWDQKILDGSELLPRNYSLLPSPANLEADVWPQDEPRHVLMQRAVCCYVLWHLMPPEAFGEIMETLKEIYDFYSFSESAEPIPHTVTFNVTGKIRW